MSFNKPKPSASSALVRTFGEIIARRDTKRVLRLWLEQRDNAAIAAERRAVEKELRARLGAGANLQRADQLFDALVREAKR